MSQNDKRGEKERRSWWKRLWTPSTSYSLGGLLLVGFAGGIIFWGGFNWAVEATNTETFCISCHEMYDNVYQEYKTTIHYNNGSGVRAVCSDCHVPEQWHHKMVRKVRATNELWHTALGTIDSREKFEAKRLELAQNVWRSMKATDSRECRNCHEFQSMDYTRQGQRAVEQHIRADEEGLTCIDCHKGIAHQLPDMRDVDSSMVVGSDSQ